MKNPKKTVAIQRLRKAQGKIPELSESVASSPEFRKWKRDTEVAIQNTFGQESDHIKEYRRIRYTPLAPLVVVAGMPTHMDSAKKRAYARGLDSAAMLLASMIDEINEYWEDDTSTAKPFQATQPSTVFVIHGRDDDTKNTVARFLEKLDLRPVILHEQPSLGRTIIEKFEDHAAPAFAVALLTPDDVGAFERDRDDLRPRARQNVVFEFGYLIGKIGREKVCAIVRGDVEIPSDCNGVIYIAMEEHDTWKLNLVQEIKAAGLDVDANRIL